VTSIILLFFLIVHLASPSSPPTGGSVLLLAFIYLFICLRQSRFGSFIRQKPCHFLFLDKKKVTKEKSRPQRILGLLFFGLPAQYNSSSFVLLKQYCLQQANAASLKTVAYPKILWGHLKSKNRESFVKVSEWWREGRPEMNKSIRW